MLDLPPELSEGDVLSVGTQWNPLVRALGSLAEEIVPPVPPIYTRLYELTAAMTYDATAKQWKATAKPVYRHAVNELYEMDDDAVAETIWAPCNEHAADVGNAIPPFDSGDRVFTYKLFAHREILHQGVRPCVWSGHLNANLDLDKTSDPGDGDTAAITWTQDNADGSAISHDGTDITLGPAGWYDLSLTLCFSPNEVPHSIVEFNTQLQLDGTAIWRVNLDDVEAVGANASNNRGYSHKFKATAGQVLTVVITNQDELNLRVTGNASAAQPRCYLSVAQIR